MAWKATNIMSGKYGRIWWNGKLVAEAMACEARVEMQMEPVKQAGRLADGQKMMGFAGTGTLRLHKVFSRVIREASASIKRGVNPEFTLVSELADPSALGKERVILRGVQLTTLPLANWEVGALTQEEVPFIFTDWDAPTTVAPR